MKTILALDTSPASRTALEEIAWRPAPDGSSFEVLSVVEPSHAWTTSEVAQETARRAEEVVQSGVERLRSAGKTATGATATGDPKAVILDHARSGAADFIVLGSHGVSALSHFLLGNVAAAVARYAPCSVEVVRAAAAGPNRGAMKILLATDGSESSERAARSIPARPWPEATQIRVLSAVELSLPTARAFLEAPFFDSAYLANARAEAMQRSQDAIAKALEILSPAPLSASESLSVLPDRPTAIILREAAEWGADLIVLGSHGRHGVDRFLLGSVSEAVATHAHCSVEVIRNAE